MKKIYNTVMVEIINLEDDIVRTSGFDKTEQDHTANDKIDWFHIGG